MKYKKSVFEVRVQRLNEVPGAFRIDTPVDAVTFWQSYLVQMPWYDPEREMCAVVHLNTKHIPIGHSLVSIGSVNETIVHPREVFRAAVAMGAHSVLLMHNHPSGDPSPSSADRSITEKVKAAGEVLQIKLVDHVIVGSEGRSFSFREAGYLG
jgi:DNA repair protein RadC